MIIKNVNIYTEDKKFKKGEIFIENGKFSSTSSNCDEVIDGEDCYAIPGLIDIHFHGCMGYDFCDGTEKAIEEIAKYQASIGVTSICPATMTIETEKLKNIMSIAGRYKSNLGSKLVGINMEGPFINSEKKGAQNSKYIRNCSIEMYREMQNLSNNLIKLVDLAPEMEGAFEFIEKLKDEVSISIAHTCADYETASLAFEKGANHVTHIYNAMPPYSHREPSVIGASFDNKNVYIELICDGVHIHPSVVRGAFAMFSDDRIVLISDSMRATGLSDGDYSLGGQAVTVKGNLANLTGSNVIAGSVTNLMDCLRTVVTKMNIPLESAIACATINPAKSIDIYDKCGSITAGKDGDLVLLNKDLSIKAVYIKGKKFNI